MVKSLLKRLALTALFATSVASYCAAADVSHYTWDFSKEIDVSKPDFKVGPNWGHIAGFYDDYGTKKYMTYKYDTTSGVDGGACLFADRPDAEYTEDEYSWSSSYAPVDDYLITPPVKGDVKIKVKRRYTSSSAIKNYIKVYEVNDDGTVGTTALASVIGEAIGAQTAEWYEVTLATGITDYKKLALKCSYIYIDDFSATSADIVPEPGLKIASVTPSPGYNNYTLDQQPDGTIPVKFTVTVTNTGQVDLTPGMENYTLTLVNDKSASDLFTVEVPCALAVGKTSAEFDVAGNIDVAQWPYATGSIKLTLRENLSGSTITPANYVYYSAYEPKFVFRNAGTTTTSSLKDPVSFGFITEAKTLNFEIYNDGRAPLTVKSVTLPDGFTSDVPSGGFRVESKDKQPLNITLSADNIGSFSGNLTIVYLDAKGKEQTYTLALEGSVIGANTWICDFGTSSAEYPAGSIANSGMNLSNGSPYYVYGSAYNADFITPLLHAEAGEALSFSIAKKEYSGASLKVYISKDRENWGDPVLTKTDLSYSWTNFSITADEAGDYYVKFEIPKVQLDNICGFTKVEKTHDIYLKETSCPDKIQGGSEVSYRVTIMAPLDIAAADYSIAVMNGETKVADIEAQDYVASAKKSYTLTANFTPDVKKTETWNLYTKITLKDGTEIRSSVKQLVIEYQPDFVFFDKGAFAGNYYKPDNRTKAIDFGRVNASGAQQEFEIYNWGAAPLTVSSITVPAGFSTNITDATVGSKVRQALTITFTAETPGTYSGNLEITYKDVNDANKVFTLPVSATLLDPSKWHLVITGDFESNTIYWPAGTIHGKNVSGGNTGSSDNNLEYVTSSSSSNNVFITPKLHAEAGETIEITAKKGGSYGTSVVNVYAAPTREGLVASETDEPELAATRRLLATISSESENEALKATSSWQNFKVVMDQAGDWYLGLEISGSMYVHELYGYKLQAPEHELVLKGSNIPDQAMQNIPVAMSLSVHNYAMQPEAADEYTLTAIVNGEEFPVASTVEIPVNTAFEDAATEIPFSVRYHTAGTFPVQLRLTIGSQTLTSEAKDVTFTEEVASSGKQVGDVWNNNGRAPFYFVDKNSEIVMLFTANDLGLNPGDKISAITFKGYYTTTDKNFRLKAFYEWTDDKTQSKPESGMYDTDGMTQIINDETPRTWATQMGTKDNTVDMVTFEFAEPLVYEAGKSLRLVTSHHEANNYFGAYYGFEQTNITEQAYRHSNDNATTFANTSWSKVNLPVMYLTLKVEPATLSGKVTDGGAAAAGAVVTLVSTDGDNVRYTATTDAEGNYSMNVIQNQRNYDVTVVDANGKEDFAEDCKFDGTSNLDLSLADVVVVDNSKGAAHTDVEGAVVKFNFNLPAGKSAIVLPVDLTADEAKALFGADVEINEFEQTTFAGQDLYLIFKAVNAIQAGKPYMISLSSDVASTLRLRAKDVKSELPVVSDERAEVNGTYVAKEKEAGLFTLEDGTFVTDNPNARMASQIAPYSAFVKILDPYFTNIKYSVGIPSGVEVIEADDIDADAEIYNLQGIRVKNPTPGIYIVNGEKVYLK
ncbi:MAG: choice-of-anchor D domain-containing protein [Bacteroidales bacterium]|nr:choice-of-anchor D domain-containing protein [Bacteroidales bacterium]